MGRSEFRLELLLLMAVEAQWKWNHVCQGLVLAMIANAGHIFASSYQFDIHLTVHLQS